MSVQIVVRENQDILNHCTKYLARDGGGPRHNFGQYDPNDLPAHVCEAWRLPAGRWTQRGFRITYETTG